MWWCGGYFEFRHPHNATMEEISRELFLEKNIFAKQTMLSILGKEVPPNSHPYISFICSSDLGATSPSKAN